MAIAFRSKSTVTHGGVSSASVTVSKPAGVTDGDFLLAAFTQGNGAPTFTGVPSGWTHLRRLSGDILGAGYGLEVYYKIASGEPSSWTWTLNSASGGIAGFVAAWSGVNPLAPIDVETGTGNNSSGTALQFESVTPTSSNGMALGIVADLTTSSSSTGSAPSGFTERVDVADGQEFLYLCEKQLSSNAATGAKNVTVSSASVGAHAAETIVLNTGTPPTVASISPSHGSIDGGDAVTIVGTNFTGATGVTIGGVACTSVVVVDPQTITCVTPAGTVGNKTVTVTTSQGSGSLT